MIDFLGKAIAKANPVAAAPGSDLLSFDFRTVVSAFGPGVIEPKYKSKGQLAALRL